MLCVNISDKRSIFKANREHYFFAKGKPLLFNLIEKQLGIGIVPIKHGGGVSSEILTTARTDNTLTLDLVPNYALVISNRSSSAVSIKKKIGGVLKRLIIDAKKMIRRTRTNIDRHGFAGTLQQELFPLSVLLHGIEKRISKILSPVSARHDDIKSKVKAAEMCLLTAITENLSKTRERFTEVLTGRAGDLQNMRILF